MKIKILLLFALAILNIPMASNAENVKIMTYNIRNGVGMDNKKDLYRIVQAIERQQPDFIAIQELDSMTGRSGNKYVLGELAMQTAMYPYYSPAIDFNGGKYGIGALTKKKPLNIKKLSLPGREEKRTMLILEFENYAIGNLHLSLTPEDALASVATIEEEAQKLAPKPFVIMGDFNSEPDSEVIKRLQQTFKNIGDLKQQTYPADEPTERIDYILVANYPDIYAYGTKVVDEKLASDHRPIVTTLYFPSNASELLWDQPYLQNVMPNEATVMFQTNVLCNTKVEYGTDTLNLKESRELVAGQEAVHDLEHKVKLTELKPGDEVYYRVRAREILENRAYHKTFGRDTVTPFYKFRVPEKNARDFTMIIVNDLHGNKQTINSLAQISKTIPYDLIVFNGDCLSEPPTREAAVKDLHVLTEAFNLAENPSLFIRGNHEIRNAYSSGAPSLFVRPGGKTYGSFTLGDIRFVSLDCGEDKPDSTWVYYDLNDFNDFRNEQLDFLKHEKNSKEFKNAKNKILISHIPVWGNTDKYQPCTEIWAPVLKTMDFDAEFGAHTHKYTHLKKGETGNPYPVFIGAGPRHDDAKMFVVKKKGNVLTVIVLDTSGNVVDEFRL